MDIDEVVLVGDLADALLVLVAASVRLRLHVARERPHFLPLNLVALRLHALGLPVH